MATNYVGPGEVVTYTAGADISSGDVVVATNLVGVALVDIANGSTGSVAIEGKFTVTKVSGAAWAVGQQLSYDLSATAFDTPAHLTEATGDVLLCAVAAEAAGSTDTTGVVILNVVGSAIQ